MEIPSYPGFEQEEESVCMCVCVCVFNEGMMEIPSYLGSEQEEERTRAWAPRKTTKSFFVTNKLLPLALLKNDIDLSVSRHAKYAVGLLY